MTMTAADHRALAEQKDRQAIEAPSQLISRTYRSQAARHRLDALLTEYRLSVSPQRD